MVMIILIYTFKHYQKTSFNIELFESVNVRKLTFSFNIIASAVKAYQYRTYYTTDILHYRNPLESSKVSQSE